MHEVHCVRNFTLCPHCDEPVAKSDIDHHVAEQHTKVTCPHCTALLMKSELDQHVADLHATEPCPECGKDISKNLLEDHKHSMHRTTACQLCHTVIDKTDLHRHQVLYYCLLASAWYFLYCIVFIQFHSLCLFLTQHFYHTVLLATSASQQKLS